MTPLNDVMGGELMVYAAGSEIVVWCARCQEQVKRVSGMLMYIELFTVHNDCPHYEVVIKRFLEDRANANVRKNTDGLETRQLQPGPEPNRC